MERLDSGARAEGVRGRHAPLTSRGVGPDAEALVASHAEALHPVTGAAIGDITTRLHRVKVQIVRRVEKAGADHAFAVTAGAEGTRVARLAAPTVAGRRTVGRTEVSVVGGVAFPHAGRHELSAWEIGLEPPIRQCGMARAASRARPLPIVATQTIGHQRKRGGAHRRIQRFGGMASDAGEPLSDVKLVAEFEAGPAWWRRRRK